jgi:hypothetical protein
MRLLQNEAVAFGFCIYLFVIKQNLKFCRKMMQPAMCMILQQRIDEERNLEWISDGLESVIHYSVDLSIPSFFIRRFRRLRSMARTFAALDLFQLVRSRTLTICLRSTSESESSGSVP